MKVIRTIEGIEEERKIYSVLKTGFVPTMGNLHRGHLSLVQRATMENDFTVVSIFVNPRQFGENEDYLSYPRTSDMDIELLKRAGVDILFMPENGEIYRPDFSTLVMVEGLSERLEGKFRPGHFAGVCTVVCKLFNIVRPSSAYFGWKDAQQLLVIKRMAADLNLAIDIAGCETIREEDGLAMSSRNARLSEEERKKAPALYRSLLRIKTLIERDGARDVALLVKEGRKIIESCGGREMDYLDRVSLPSLDRIEKVCGKVMAAGAVRIGRTRLIDNIRMEIEAQDLSV